jgi:hypothetical protein
MISELGYFDDKNPPPETADSLVVNAVLHSYAVEMLCDRFWDTVIVPSGTFHKVPEDGTHVINFRQSPYVPKGEMYFVNSNKLPYEGLQ